MSLPDPSKPTPAPAPGSQPTGSPSGDAAITPSGPQAISPTLTASTEPLAPPPTAPLTPSAASSQPAGWGSLKLLTGYQWFVFLVAVSAWTLDCMDQQFFTLTRLKAMTELVANPRS